MVIVTGLVTVLSAMEVAVTVADCEEAVATGAVYFTELVVLPESVPGPVSVQLTPAEL
jgi:hypothetical protein